MTAPDDLGAVVRRFWAAAAGDDRTALHRFLCADVTCVAGPGVLHGVADTLRSGALTHAIDSLRDVQIHTRATDLGEALVVYDVPDGGRAVQSQLWRRDDTTWRLASVHASTPRRGFDSTVWRVVGDPLVASSAPGPLAGTTVAVKDVFAVAGFPTGGGVPAYERSAPIATEHATAVARLLNSGAHLRGIARTDQFAYSMAGDNPHHSTPPNAAVPAALPGGSSSGPASAVAHGDADLGLATDTAGSIRTPASYQGLWGLRSTHGSVSTRGLLPLAPDFDTIGLLSRDPDLLALATTTLLDAPSTTDIGCGMATLDDIDDIGLVRLAEAFRVHQAFQAWSVHGDWITAHPGALEGSAAARFAAAAAIDADDDARACDDLAALAAKLDERLGDDLLDIPAAATAAPRRWASGAEVEKTRTATLQLTAIAAATGRPAVTFPHRETSDGPIGRSLVGPRGSDTALIARAIEFASARPVATPESGGFPRC
ncbi:amidase family protein [Gordonia sputi]|uniref:amidase family protein n=1 Tax=Gordonia sputi TaxID=36823 RepID=UPI002043376D|nr:amidase family protein [Gordonia sputi]MCM3894903.1 amidase family protein [Gordonia sputi]